MLSGIFYKYTYREAKGIIEGFLEQINIKPDIVVIDSRYFLPGHRFILKLNRSEIGEFGILETNDLIYYELNISELNMISKPTKSFSPIPKYPAQIEDLTIILPSKTKTGEVINLITSIDKRIFKSELREIYQNAYTFRIWYQDKNKTLTDKEVETLRNRIISSLRNKFGAEIKE